MTNELKNNEKKFNFEKYDLYQRSLIFSNKMFNLTKKFPNSEQFGLSMQLKRAAMSISLNLAEGFNNQYKKDKIRYYRIARGSMHECVPGLTISYWQNFIDEKEYRNMYDESFELSRMVSGLIKSIKNRK
jgi:four helix bundle protein